MNGWHVRVECWAGESLVTQTYVVVAAIRIQTWLARTPRLSLIRGASRALREITLASTISDLLKAEGLAGLAEVDSDAGDVDGLIVVRTDESVADRVRAVIGGHVQWELPGLEWSSWQGPAATVLDALNLARDGELLIPELIGVPFAQQCQQCRAEIATEQIVIEKVEGSTWCGADCRRRFRTGHAGHSGAHRESMRIPGASFGPGFAELATVAGLPEARATSYLGKQNHLAVIAADGNAIGDLFNHINDLITANGAALDVRTRAVSMMDGATKDALRAAADAITDPAGKAAVEPHFVGGDDVLVSVPAPLAWSFVIALTSAFEAAFKSAFESAFGQDIRQWSDLRQLVQGTSLGVGICFAHLSHPFSSGQAWAHRAMKAAKKQVEGTCAAVSWVDLTAENTLPPKRHRTASDLNSLRDGVRVTPADVLLELPTSARAALATIVENGLAADAKSGDGRRRAVVKLADYAHRNNQPQLGRWLAETGDHELVLRELSNGLSLARWWPGASRPDHALAPVDGTPE